MKRSPLQPSAIKGLLATTLLTLALAIPLHGADAKPRKPSEGTGFRVAVLHGTSANMRHSDEFDAALKVLGWDHAKYPSTAEGLGKLTGIAVGGDGTAAGANELAGYDMALLCPLFNFKNFKAQTDMAPYVGVFRDFIRGGGALVVTDALYGAPYAWLKDVDPGLVYGTEGCKATLDPIDNDPVSPFRFLPNTKRDYNSWGHLTLPEGSDWEVVLRCGEGKPIVLLKRIGKGFLYLTALRQPNKETLENLRANLEIQRIGLTVTRFDMPVFKIGDGTISIDFRNLTKEPVEIEGELLISPVSDDGTASRPAPLSFTTKARFEPDGEGSFSLPYANSLRGHVNVRLTIGSGKNKATLFDRDLEMPALVETLPPRYRSLALESELAKKGEIVIGYAISPFREETAGMTVETKVVDASGKEVCKASTRKPTELRERFPMKVGALKAGAYHISSTLRDGAGKVLATNGAPFRVLAPAECKTFINDDMNLVVDGEEFFPLGLYHIGPGDLKKHGPELGINTIQLFSWFPAALPIADELGIKVIWEQNHRNANNIVGCIQNQRFNKKGGPTLIEQPSIIAWYGVDDPYESNTADAIRLSEAFHRGDISRPTFMVSCRPRLYPQHVKCADIFAPDPYPYHKKGADILMVADWMDAAWKATKGDQPVICVPQCSAWVDEGPFRATAYLALTHEARGIIWYPWDDGADKKSPYGGRGLKYNPELQVVFKDVVSQIKVLTPALLNKEGRKQLKSADGKIHGLFCQDKSGDRLMILVNPYDAENTIDLAKTPGLEGFSKLNGLFENDTAPTDKPLILKPYATKAYRLAE